jgi:hypothetical protein
MHRELKQYLNAVVILLCLNVSLLVTFLWVSAGEMSVLFLLVPTVVAVLVGWVVWLVADSFA